MTKLVFRDAICEALDEELTADPHVLFFGEDVAEAGGVFATSRGLSAKHGVNRVFDTPISELALTGAAFGAAVSGLRPVIEIMFGDFLGLSLDALVNQAAKYAFLSNGQCGVPLVLRSAVGGGGNFGAIHSQVPTSWFYGVPGLKIVAPAFPLDAKTLLKAAIRDENPVLFFEHKRLYATSAEVPTEASLPPHIGKAAILRRGTDLTLVGSMKTVHDCLHAADILERAGISVEVVDVRTIRPLDIETILESVTRTRRMATVDEAPPTGGWPADMVAAVSEHLRPGVQEVWRISTPDHPIPYSPTLEQAFFQSGERIAASIRDRIT